MKTVERKPFNFEQLAKGTPEFQALSEEKQTERMRLLHVGLDGLSASTQLGTSQREIAIRAGELLERAFTGKFEGIIQPIGTIQESKSRKQNRR